MWSGVLEINALFKLHVAIGKGTEEYRGKDALRELCACHHTPFTRQSVCEGGSVRLTEEMRQKEETDGTTEMVKGVMGEAEKYLVLDDTALEAIAQAGTSEAMAVASVVDINLVPTERFNALYYLRPDSKVKRSDDAVKVVVRALERQKKALITKWAPRGREMLVAIYPQDEALVMNGVMYESEVRPPDEKWLISTDGVADAEVEVAEQLLDTLPEQFAFAEAQDNAVAVRQEAIEAARKGKKIPTRKPTQTIETAPDLMASLEAALKAAPAVKDKRRAKSNGKVPVAA
jgi:DNA end-binding protein Ku